jgi:hypothetical protein
MYIVIRNSPSKDSKEVGGTVLSGWLEEEDGAAEAVSETPVPPATTRGIREMAYK